MESLWPEMTRGIRGMFRKISPKRAQRYVDEFTSRLDARDRDTIDHMAALACGMSTCSTGCSSPTTAGEVTRGLQGLSKPR